jgi:GNAT superfamily N-acetyltransferase
MVPVTVTNVEYRAACSAWERIANMSALDSSPPYTFMLTVSETWEAAITEELLAFNRQHAPALALEPPPQAPAPLHVYALNTGGSLVGGVVGRTHTIRLWLEVRLVWVDESYRRQGIGHQLMMRAEQEARQRGCQYARVATSQYQAPGFYAEMGYTVYGTLEHCPPGETVSYFWKPLATTASQKEGHARANTSTSAAA